MTQKLLYYFEGFDESIIQLNDYIFESGFEFVKYDLKEFEIKFKHLLTDSDDHLQNKDSHYDISIPFFDGLIKSRYFNHDEILANRYIVFLDDKQLVKYENIEKENKELDNRVQDLINKLNLLKSGYFKLISVFPIEVIENENWQINDFPVVYSSPSKRLYSIYSFLSEDLREPQYFKGYLPIPKYLRLAFNSFIEHYNIEDEKLKFVILMIALESIFNKISSDPIQHIISRMLQFF